MDRVKRKSPLAYAAFPLFICAMAALVISSETSFGVFSRIQEAIRAWIEVEDSWASRLYPSTDRPSGDLRDPGEVVQIAGGYAFGFWMGSLYSLIGITLGSIANFYAGRLLGRPFVESLFDRDKIDKVEIVTGSRKGAAGFFLLFVVPGIPKDVLCYVAGISKLGLLAFIAVSMAGRLPGILGSSTWAAPPFRAPTAAPSSSSA